MKNTDRKKIIRRDNYPLSKLSVLSNGNWIFRSPTNFVKNINGVSYYKITSKFGLGKSNLRNPSKYSIQGKPGDYVAVRAGVYSYVPKELFKKIDIKRSQKQEKPYKNSKLLKDKNFITNLLKNR